MNKEKLIKAINTKGFSNSLISIYYNTGRALPFRAQRFPDGRDSKWYRSQFVEVHNVKPGGKVASMEMHMGFTIEMVRGKMLGRMIRSIVGAKKKILNLRVFLVQHVDLGFYWIF